MTVQPKNMILGANDQHTLAGRKLGRGLDHFRKEGAKVIPEPTEPDLYVEEAYRLWAMNAAGQVTAQDAVVAHRRAFTPVANCLRGIRARADPLQVEVHSVVETALSSRLCQTARKMSRRDFRPARWLAAVAIDRSAKRHDLFPKRSVPPKRPDQTCYRLEVSTIGSKDIVLEYTVPKTRCDGCVYDVAPRDEEQGLVRKWSALRSSAIKLQRSIQVWLLQLIPIGFKPGSITSGTGEPIADGITSPIDHRSTHRSRNPFQLCEPSLWAASQANSGAVNTALTCWVDHRSRPRQPRDTALQEPSP